ncbi:CotS family spore coat protein, partial [Brevibacillus sp. NRS-1366]|uniref:CotS family spore coat protein n=1 Tax=Brevibacillus sp. NRS-1366 TaxID=3233899 RepID=UPI003D1F6869
MEQYLIQPWDVSRSSETAPVDWDMHVPPEVDEIAEQVMRQYDMSVSNRTLITSKPDKGGAIWRIDTDKGPRSLKLLHRSPERSLYSVGFQEYVVKQGARVPKLIPARDGKLFVEMGGKLWIVTDWISLQPATKVDLAGAQELCYGLGEFHRHSKGYIPPFGAKNSSRLFRWPNYYQKIAKKIGWMRDMASSYRDTIASEAILAVVDQYEQQALNALKRLQESAYSKMVALGEPHWGLVHQDYGWSNGQNGPGGLWVIDLDGVAYDLPFRDLRKLITSTMDDMGVWDVSWMRGMIDAYHQANPLDLESFEILLIDMSMPNEFYKHLKEMFFDPIIFLNTEAGSILQRVVATDQTKWQALAEMNQDKSKYMSGNYEQVLAARQIQRVASESKEEQTSWLLQAQEQKTSAILEEVPADVVEETGAVLFDPVVLEEVPADVVEGTAAVLFDPVVLEEVPADVVEETGAVLSDPVVLEEVPADVVAETAAVLFDPVVLEEVPADVVAETGAVLFDPVVLEEVPADVVEETGAVLFDPVVLEEVPADVVEETAAVPFDPVIFEEVPTELLEDTANVVFDPVVLEEVPADVVEETAAVPFEPVILEEVPAELLEDTANVVFDPVVLEEIPGELLEDTTNVVFDPVVLEEIPADVVEETAAVPFEPVILEEVPAELLEDTANVVFDPVVLEEIPADVVEEDPVVLLHSFALEEMPVEVIEEATSVLFEPGIVEQVPSDVVEKFTMVQKTQAKGKEKSFTVQIKTNAPKKASSQTSSKPESVEEKQIKARSKSVPLEEKPVIATQNPAPAEEKSIKVKSKTAAVEEKPVTAKSNPAPAEEKS